MAEVKQPILGADFHRLHVDMRNRTLSDPTTSLDCLQHRLLPLVYVLQRDMYHRLLAEFPGLTQPYTEDLPVKHSVMHHITTSGAPVSSCTRRLAPERL